MSEGNTIKCSTEYMVDQAIGDIACRSGVYNEGLGIIAYEWKQCGSVCCGIVIAVKIKWVRGEVSPT